MPKRCINIFYTTVLDFAVVVDLPLVVSHSLAGYEISRYRACIFSPHRNYPYISCFSQFRVEGAFGGNIHIFSSISSLMYDITIWLWRTQAHMAKFHCMVNKYLYIISISETIFNTSKTHSIVVCTRSMIQIDKFFRIRWMAFYVKLFNVIMTISIWCQKPGAWP